MVKLEYLRYFKMAAEKLSFNSAAKSLFKSSTSIVHAIDQLENHYGVSLFVRKKSIGLTLTADGKKLLGMANDLLQNAELIDDEFISSHEGVRGELIVGCQEGLSWSLLPRVICALQIEHPNLKINMQTTWMEQRFAPLVNGEIDVLVTFLVDETLPENFESTVICQPKTCALMRKGHPLDNGLKRVSLAKLAEYPQISIKDGDGHKLFYGMYEDLGFRPEILFMTNISTGAQSMVGRTDAVSLRILRPASDFSPLGDEIISVEIEETPIGPDLVVVTNKMRTYSRETKHEVFTKAVQRAFSSGEMKQHIYY